LGCDKALRFNGIAWAKPGRSDSYARNWRDISGKQLAGDGCFSFNILQATYLGEFVHDNQITKNSWLTLLRSDSSFHARVDLKKGGDE